MIRKFDEAPTAASRSLQIWLILIARATNRQTITYGMLAGMLGFEGAGTMGAILGRVAWYCHQHGLPPLTAIVVNQETGLPGLGFPLQGADLSREQERVFHFHWYDLVPPEVEDLVPWPATVPASLL